MGSEFDGAPPPNRGAERLREIEQSHARIAHEVGCAGAPVVFDWRLGRRAPSDYFRIRLHKLYGIPIDAWDHSPTGEPIARRRGRGWARPRGAGPELTEAHPAELGAAEPIEPTELDPDRLTAVAVRLEAEAAAPTVAPLASTKAEVDAQLHRARAAAVSPGIAPGQAARLSAEIRGLLRLRAQLETAEPVTLDRLARSDAFRALRDEVVAVARDCPRCLDRLIEVLTAPSSATTPPPAPSSAGTPAP